VLLRPDCVPLHGRDQIELFQERRTATHPGTHSITRMVASADKIAAVGCFTCARAGHRIDFADVFTISEYGLIVSQDTCFLNSHTVPQPSCDPSSVRPP
jgi:hypothetical protein